MRRLRNEVTPFEKEINHILGLYHGLTYISEGTGFYEIYTFDTDQIGICGIDYKLLKQFMLYFREQARKLIAYGEQEKIIIQPERSVLQKRSESNTNKMSEFLKKIRVNRYYLGGKHQNVYLTAKEAQCAYWLIQGKSAEEIAMIESSSIKTVLTHLENIRRKLNCSKQTQIVRVLLETGLLECEQFHK